MTLNLILTIFSLFLLILYTAGNYQNFQDQTQKIILWVLSGASIFNSILAEVLFIESIIKIFTENHKIKLIVYSFHLLISFIFNICCMEISDIIIYLSGGLGKIAGL